MANSGEIKRYRRFKGWDYAKGASLFITIATAPRRALFGVVRDGVVVLSALGEKVKEALEAIPLLNPGILLFGYVVMPDHVHFNCALLPGLAEPLKMLGNAIRRFKNYTTKLAKHSLAIKSSGLGLGKAFIFDGQTTYGLWQQGYHDYILLSREMIDATERYIAYNPMKWELMYGVEGALRVIEPLFLPRLDPGHYWKGVGNLALLDPAEKLLSLRISRQVQGAAMAKMLARIENAVSQGYIIISGFISKGEQAVRDMLCRRSDARFIRILPSCIPNRRFRPESRYVAPFAEGRYLEIAQGNDEVEFGRRACLDINAEIIEIAKAGQGLALYWKPDGPHKLAERSSAIKSVEGGEWRSSAIKSAGGGSLVIRSTELQKSAIKSSGGMV
jgi:REP element-mobilizing transposase RayT